MVQYVVKAVVGDRTASLLVVLDPQKPCSTLLDAVRSRLPTLMPTLGSIDTVNCQIALHLDKTDGPVLDVKDLLSNILSGANDTVFAVVQATTVTTSPHVERRADQQTLQIRVVTPEAARSCLKLGDIPPLTTDLGIDRSLRDLKGIVQQQLGYPANIGPCPEIECNCSFARKIGHLCSLSPNVEGTVLDTILVVSGVNHVVALKIEEMTEDSIRTAAKDYYFKNKIVTFIGGVQDPAHTSNRNTHYLVAPVLSVCSEYAHQPHSFATGDPHTSGRCKLIVDIHTFEAPIVITAHNANLSIAEARLHDCAINGVLTIFAVQRWSLGQTYEAGTQGTAAIFKMSKSWQHPVGESDRGIANMLSTLRVFCDIAGGCNMDEAGQDQILHIIYLLTKFPPAVRAAYILMRGETPRVYERAALSQALYEVLKTVVPLSIVRNDPSRHLEGCRLLFGLILEKAKNLKLNPDKRNATMPYLAMKVYDVRNQLTMDPIMSLAVQTKEGLVDQGFYDAFAEAGPLRWENENNMARSSMEDPVLKRIAAVTGGTAAQVIRFDLDAVTSSRRYADGGNIAEVIAPPEFLELQYLATLCSHNGLTVVPPAELASATAPVLTLDRNGSLAVYIGRAGCAAPGTDILMFRPTGAREEEQVDVSIITGLLEPILAARTANGTIIFEAFGTQHRKIRDPDEVTVLCVDLSRSMEKRCGFTDVELNEDGDAEIRQKAQEDCAKTSNSRTMEDLAYPLPDLDDLKEYLRTHESYEDFLAIVGTGDKRKSRVRNANVVMNILDQLHRQQVNNKLEELKTTQLHATRYLYRRRLDNINQELGVLNNRFSRMQKHRDKLCAWLVATTSTDFTASDPLVWRPGDAIPQLYRPSQPNSTPQEQFEIPLDYCCPISSEIMDDPVSTTDNHTYERSNIERWFCTKDTSPKTNLKLSSLQLKPNIRVKEEIVGFLKGADIIAKYSGTGRLRNMTTAYHVSFKSPLDTWKHRNMSLPRNYETIRNTIDTSHAVFITPLDPMPKVSTDGQAAPQELCLVKVYRDSDDTPVVSYWEPKNTTKTLASAIFRYYRQKFEKCSWASFEDSLVLWTGLKDIGDGSYQGKVIEEHWRVLSEFFNRADATGKLKAEPCLDKVDEDGNVEGRTEGEHEQPLVFKLMLGDPPDCERTERKTLNRLDVLKQLFDAYINRLLAYNFQAHLGLVTFSTRAKVAQSITPALENFRHKLSNMSASGDTAIWDSIALAQDQLQQYADEHPNAKLRIICISDGSDNKSTHNVVDVTNAILRAGIVTDSICIGRAQNNDLQTLSYISGGLTFAPLTLEEAMTICELEPVLSLLERPEAVSRDEDVSRMISQFRRRPNLHNFNRLASRVVIQRVTEDSFPQRKQHPELSKSFIELGSFAKHAAPHHSNRNVRVNRIQAEIRNSGANPHPDYDIYICEPNMGLWKVVMQGPSGSSYEGGTFLLYVEMAEKYPMFAPQARFITPIYHPNINRHGRICLSLLDRNWAADMSTKELIDSIYALLLQPESSDPINTVVTLDFHWDAVQFKEEVQRHIAKHACKTRAEWRNELAG
ncbi:hypothetical protein ACN47E_008037 [Coniothyrium glycines]